MGCGSSEGLLHKKGCVPLPCREGTRYNGIVVPDRAHDKVCLQCASPLTPSIARGPRENVAFVLGTDIRRCLSCEARFLCFGRFVIPSRPRSADDPSLVIVWLAIAAGIAVCLGIALWTLRRFHRWPF